MTVIVGVEHRGQVWIGGDSASIAGETITARADEKVFRNGPYLLGFAGSFRVGQIIRYAFSPPGQVFDDDMQHLCVDFVDAMRVAQREKRALRRVDEETHESDSQFLLGYRGRLYAVDGDYQVERPAELYSAIGVGADFALGALAATNKKDPQKRVLAALEASARHCAGVRGPFVVLRG